jgi:hypothetical protein
MLWRCVICNWFWWRNDVWCMYVASLSLSLCGSLDDVFWCKCAELSYGCAFPRCLFFHSTRVHKFYKNRSHLKILGSRRVTWCKCHIDDPEVLVAILQNGVAVTIAWLIFAPLPGWRRTCIWKLHHSVGTHRRPHRLLRWGGGADTGWVWFMFDFKNCVVESWRQYNYLFHD